MLRALLAAAGGERRAPPAEEAGADESVEDESGEVVDEVT